MMQDILSVARKELKDAFRDRRSLLSAIVYSAFGAFVIFLILNALAIEENNEMPTRLAVLGAQHAPVLVELIANDEIEVSILEHKSPAGALIDHDAVLVINDAFPIKLNRTELAELELYVDQTTDAGLQSVERLQIAISAIQSRYAQTRLIAQGINPDIIRAVDLKIRDVAEDSVATMAISRLLVLFFVMAPFFASLSIAADMTAGERERDALQPLLMQPAGQWSIVMGKWLVATAIGLLGVGITVLTAAFAINASPTTEIGVLLYASVTAQRDMMIILAPFIGMIAALQMAISLRSKTYKEAQTYLSLLAFLPVVVAFTAVFKKEHTPDVVYLPIAHHLGMLQQALLDRPLDPALTLAGGTLALAAAGVCLYICVITYRSERLLRA